MGKSAQLNANDVLELVLADRTRVPLVRDMTIGSAPDSTVRVDDPAVSPRQARITVGDGEVLLEDAGSSHGTWLDGRRLDGPERLGDGARIRVGDQELVVERHRDEDEASRSVTAATTPRVPGEPGLRHRAREPRVRRYSGHERRSASVVRRRYAAAGVAGTVLVACLAAGILLRYEPGLTEAAAKGVAWGVLIALWFGFFVPLLVVLAGLLRRGRRERKP